MPSRMRSCTINKWNLTLAKAGRETDDQARAPATEAQQALSALAPDLRRRGVPEASFVMIDPATAQFVTGKTEAETRRRFAALHPAASGHIRLMREVYAEAGLADPALSDD